MKGDGMMSMEKVKAYFAQFGMEQRVLEFEVSSATVELAAQAAGVEPKRIAKTLSFSLHGAPLVIVMAGDARIDNHAHKEWFGAKAKMLTPDETLAMVGHPVGGVCPFAVNDGVTVYLDESLRRFDTVFPACGSGNSAIELTLPELERYAGNPAWVDVCKGWRADAETP